MELDELDTEVEARIVKLNREAGIMAANNEFVAAWRRDSAGLADLIVALKKIAGGREIISTWMAGHPDIDPPIPDAAPTLIADAWMKERHGVDDAWLKDHHAAA